MKKLLMILVVLVCFINLDAKPKEVVCILDSITQGYGIPDAQRTEFSFSDYFADGVHPNIKGVDYLAKFIYKEIKPALK